MTDTMSSEGDSSKSVLSESIEKSGTDNTDSSQDSHDVGDAKTEKPTTENDVEKKEEEKPAEDKKQTEEKSPEKKSEPDEKPENDKKAQSDTEEVEDEEGKSDKDKKPKKEKKEKEKEKEEDEDKDESENSENEEEESKPGKKDVPLLDQPLEKSGKRERKNVQRFNEEFAAEVKEGTKIDFDVGSGTALGDIPRVDASISRFKNDDLKLLHKLLFKIPGKNTMIKKNIRKFNGFDFKKNSEEYTKRVGFVHKYEVKHLKSICEMLDLQKNGSKDDIVERIFDFLLEPKDSGKPVGGGRPKRSAAVKANNRGYSSHDDYSSDEKHSSRARRDKGKRLSLKDDSSSDEDFQPNQSDGSDEHPRVNKRKRRSQKKDSSEEEPSEVSAPSSDESDDEPKAKRKKSPAKVNNKAKPKSTPGKRGRPPASAKKTPSRGKKAKVSSEEDESDQKDEGSSSEDEPLVKKAKNSQPPTDDEIKTFIKSVLEGANLEEITMKTVCQRVYDHYPDFDLTHKKDFIKTTVKSLIST